MTVPLLRNVITGVIWYREWRSEEYINALHNAPLIYSNS
jgi:hypothetical protein